LLHCLDFCPKEDYYQLRLTDADFIRIQPARSESAREKSRWVFIFRAERGNMPSPVQSLSTRSSDDDKLKLSDLIRKDLALVPRKKTLPILSIFRGNREVRFYIRANDVSCPVELAKREFQDIKESAVRLPASAQAVHSLTRIFEMLSDEFRFSKPVIRGCHNGDVIFYTVSPLD